MTAPPEFGLFPWHRSCPFQPPKEYAQLRETTPVAKVELSTGLPAYVITRYEDIRQVLTDPRSSSDRAHEGFPYYIPIPQQFRTEAGFIGWDPPKHTLHRRLAAVSGEFTKVRVAAMLPRIEQIVNNAVQSMIDHGPPVDLVAKLALDVPLQVVCGVLGIPSADHDYLHDRTDVLFGGRSSAEERGVAITEVNKYLADLIELKAVEPTDDLISRIVARYKDEGMYDLRDLVNTIRLLLNGGHETSAAMIAIGTMTLLEHPSELAKFKADPDGMVHDVVEELLRFLSPGDLATSRVALEDMEVGGVTIKKGEGMIVLGYAANRDPEAFPEPDKFDVNRGERKHIAFGHGLHHCIGAELARVELQVVLKTLFRRIPDIRLAKPWNELRYKDGNIMYGVYEMPVTW